MGKMFDVNYGCAEPPCSFLADPHTIVNYPYPALTNFGVGRGKVKVDKDAQYDLQGFKHLW